MRNKQANDLTVLSACGTGRIVALFGIWKGETGHGGRAGKVCAPAAGVSTGLS